tara:strand:- start:1713 stop:1931 length:219 start_codon:yes stop_codon:yes gene_type:complete
MATIRIETRAPEMNLMIAFAMRAQDMQQRMDILDAMFPGIDLEKLERIARGELKAEVIEDGLTGLVLLTEKA